jgi:hypothetical protein
MRIFLFTPILLLLISGTLSGQVKTENSSVEVLASKWSKFRQKVEKPDNQTTGRALPLSNRANRNFERNRRVNDPVDAPDPNAETIEGRSAALEKNVQEARSPKSVYVDGFLYQARIRNAGKSAVEVLFWEYQFKERANPANVTTRHFLCGVNIKPNKEQELSVFSTFSPAGVISAESLGDKSGNLFEEKILINRVEYADGTIWQRRDWNFSELKPSIERALATPWEREMCRNL